MGAGAAEWERAVEDKRIRARRATMTEVEERTWELLLLLVATGMEGGLCGGRKLLLLM